MRIVCPACRKNCVIDNDVLTPRCPLCDEKFFAHGVNVLKLLDMQRESHNYFDRRFTWILIGSGALLTAIVLIVYTYLIVPLIDGTLVIANTTIPFLVHGKTIVVDGPALVRMALRICMFSIVAWTAAMILLYFKADRSAKKKFPELYRCKSGKYETHRAPF